MSDVKLLLWDFDGTLGYREGGWSSALHQAILRNA
jgi:phosphoglycolate phosphatase-like HAD superfamily hydrolase